MSNAVIQIESRRSPQIEDGFTRIANELLDAIVAFPLTTREYKVLLAVIRMTYGYQRKEVEIGLTGLAKACGLDHSNAGKAVRQLIEKGVLYRKEGAGMRVLGVAKDYSKWYGQNDHSGMVKTTTPKYGQNDHSGMVKTTTHIKKGLKKVITPLSASQTSPRREKSAELEARFDRFWAAYPRKVSKGQARRAFAKLNPSEQLLADILDGIERAKTSEKWHEEGGRYIQHPGTWLNAEGWKDQLPAAKYTPEQLAVMGVYNAIMPAAGWPQAVIDPYSAQRASEISQFVRFSDKVDFAEKYFAYCAKELEPRDGCGFDWLIKRETYVRVREGVIRAKEKKA